MHIMSSRNPNVCIIKGEGKSELFPNLSFKCLGFALLGWEDEVQMSGGSQLMSDVIVLSFTYLPGTCHVSSGFATVCLPHRKICILITYPGSPISTNMTFKHTY